MKNTWASGAIELLKHANAHDVLETAFDDRMAFISADNAVETIIRTYLSLPKSFFNSNGPSRSEFDECHNSFTKYLDLVNKYAKDKIVGIEPGDIEFYHRIRNTLYHDGTGITVDKQHLKAYLSVANLLLRRLFNVDLEGIDFEDNEKLPSIENIILNWNIIEELLTELFASGRVHRGTFKWEEAITKGLLSREFVNEVVQLRQARNILVHSTKIDKKQLPIIFNQSKSVLKELKERVEDNKQLIQSRNFFYFPSISKLSGKLTLESFKGESAYHKKNNPEGIVSVWIINLRTPINVHQEEPILEEGNPNHNQYNIKKIQLVSNKINFKELENKNVIVEGTFYGWSTAHHFTPVLLNVTSIHS